MPIRKRNFLHRYIVLLISTVIVTLLLLNLLVPQTMAQSLLSREQIEEMIVRQAQAWENQDVEAITDDFAEDGVFIAAGFKFVGKQRIAKAARDYFQQFHQTNVEIKNVIIENNKGLVEWDWQDRNRQSGKKGFAEDAIVFELAGEKIIYWREYIEKKKAV